MSATDSEAEDQAYFLRIEEAFIRLRGAPLLLSPADWQVARRWRRDGVPLALVLETLTQAFADRAERQARGRVNSLRYFASHVDEAWSRARELAAGGGGGSLPGPSVADRLAALASALPDSLPAREEWAERILAAGAAGDAAETVEARLVDLDAKLVRDLESRISPADRDAAEHEVEAALARLADRLQPADRDPVRARLYDRTLRRHFQLPELSLFTLDG